MKCVDPIHRSGHLFQNRYKSLVCEEDPYLLELVRYIHLTPLRVGVVKDISALKTYPWSGHSGCWVAGPCRGKKQTKYWGTSENESAQQE